MKPDLNIEIIGVNASDQAAFNSMITDERSLPWLQDTEDNSVWVSWEATWRDVRILDSQNRLVAVFNLTEFSLSEPENYAMLKSLFLSAATVTDTDKDRLPDDWEQHFLHGTSAGPEGDLDADGKSNFAEFAFGTDPGDAKSVSSIRSSFLTSGAEKYLSVTFRRRAGSFLDYTVESSSDLEHWTASTTEVVVKKAPRNLYDGTGISEVTYSLVKPISATPQRYLRVRAVPRSRP